VLKCNQEDGRPKYQNEREDDATDKEPFAIFERNDRAVPVLAGGENNI
jgi:hypothetical protein